ncbi:MAG: TM1812 family CRISPR-associated protein [Ruminococcus sp.]|nr:TM1812 family CRISPR-associated protein [Ruminococcus sp.]
MKKFICVSPFQPAGRLGSGIYFPANSDRLRYDKEISFPIIPVINGYTDNGEEIIVITVVTEHPDTLANYETMKKAVDELAKEKDLKINYKEIKVAYDSNLEVQLGIFTQLIDMISDNDKIYCDITFGTKVMNQILTMSVNYGYRVRKDVMVGCMVYGEKEHNTGLMKIYDITSLIFLDEIVRLMAEKGVGDPTDAIKMLMDWGDEDA